MPNHKSLTTYTSLLATSRQLNHEASAIFKAECLPHLTFYLNDETELCRMGHSFTSSDLVNSGAKVICTTARHTSFTEAVESIPAFFTQGFSTLAMLSSTFSPGGFVVQTGEYRASAEIRGKLTTHSDGKEYSTFKVDMPSAHEGRVFARWLPFQYVSSIEVRLRDIDWTSCRGGDVLGQPKADDETDEEVDRNASETDLWFDDHFVPQMEAPTW